MCELGGVAELAFVAVHREVSRAHHAEPVRNPIVAVRAAHEINPGLPFLPPFRKIVKKNAVPARAVAAFDHTVCSRHQRHVMQRFDKLRQHNHEHAVSARKCAVVLKLGQVRVNLSFSSA